ncbi:endonuclease/exonuclease/phosphatase family protein [Phenylobacterium sp.]|uniref:endonuclease/exonuclease/phosphatase family protein n=1 Tax=Phenylobacterium sp. TaxID=1871053 RepID=UPI00286B3AC0|nr:endonuclease/exonuclease/phosphatase family protein [Phenylobacterium sp.]
MGFLRIVATGLGAVCALAAILAQGGRWSGLLDVLTHFAPIWLAGSVLLLVMALVTPARTRGGRLAMLGGLGVLSTLWLVTPELLRSPSAPAPADATRRLKVIQFNAEPRPARFDTMARWLADQDPDILVLEDSTAQLRALIQRRMPRRMTCSPGCQVAILSRARPVDVATMGGGRWGLDPHTIVATFAPADGGYVVVGSHYGRPGAVARKSMTAKTFVQAENSRRLHRMAAPLPRARLIVVGDFNSTPWSFALRRDDAALGIERRTQALYSWPAHWFGPPFLPIDQIYAGPAWRTVSVTRGPRIGSDHYPVVAVLALPRSP